MSVLCTKPYSNGYKPWAFPHNKPIPREELETPICLNEKDDTICPSHWRARILLLSLTEEANQLPRFSKHFDFAIAIPLPSIEQSHRNEGKVYPLVAQVDIVNLFIIIIHLCQAWLWLSQVGPCLVRCQLLWLRWAMAASFFSGAVLLFDRFEHHWDLHSLLFLEWTLCMDWFA